MDGTLVGSSGVVSPRVWEAIDRARGAGLRLALCSGRPAFGATRGYAERMDPGGWHVFQNGASVLDLRSGRSLSEELPAATVTMLVERARREGGARVLELYTDTGYAVESEGAVARAHAGLLGVPFTSRAFEALQGTLVRAQWLVPIAEADAVLAEPHPGLEVTYSTSPVMPSTAFVNLTRSGVSKASAVRALAATCGIPLEDVMMVGDGHNDVGALRIVGMPVAMGNGEPAVKAAARLTVRDVDEGGLVEAIDAALATR